MTKIRNFSQQKPFLFSLAVCCIFFLGMIGSGALISLFPDSVLFDFLAELIDILWPVALAFLLGYRFIYTKKGFGPTFKAGMIVTVIFSSVFLYRFVDAVLVSKVQMQTLPAIIMGVVSIIGVSIREEVIFRGVIGNSLSLRHATDKKSLWFTVLVSSALYGGLHFMDIFQGAQLPGLIPRIIMVFTSGLLYSAVYLRGGNIWVVILIHIVKDTVALFDSTFIVTAATNTQQVINWKTIVFPCIQTCSALFILRKAKQPPVFVRLAQLRNQFGWEAPAKEK